MKIFSRANAGGIACLHETEIDHDFIETAGENSAIVSGFRN